MPRKAQVAGRPPRARKRQGRSPLALAGACPCDTLILASRSGREQISVVFSDQICVTLRHQPQEMRTPSQRRQPQIPTCGVGGTRTHSGTVRTHFPARADSHPCRLPRLAELLEPLNPAPVMVAPRTSALLLKPAGLGFAWQPTPATRLARGPASPSL